MKAKKVIFMSLAGVFLLCLGMIAGIFLNANVFSGAAKDAPLKDSGKEKIAVVNMDVGVIEGENEVLYALKLLPYCGVDYTITGLSDAREGLSSGKYDAYVVIPETFSRNVSSINTKPESIILQYSLNKELDGLELQSAERKVEKLKEGLSDSLTKVYLSSVLEGLHSAQNSAAAIISNDKKDAEKLNAISAGDLIAMVEVPELEKVTNDTEALELTAEYSRQDTLADELNSKYKGQINTAQNDMSSMKTDMAAINTDMAKLMKLLEDANKGMDDFTLNQLTILNAYEGYYKEYDKYIADYNAGSKAGSVMAFKEFVKAKHPNAPSYSENALANEFTDKKSNVKNLYTTATTESANLQKKITALNSSFAGYDFSSYINSSEQDSVVEAMKENNKAIEGKVSANTAKQTAYTGKVTKASTDYVTSMQRSVADAESKSNKMLQDGLSAAKASRNESSKTNITIMGALPEVLPYTRLGEVENKETYEFMASPLNLTANAQDASVGNIDENATQEEGGFIDKWGTTLLLIAIVLICLPLIALCVKRLKGGQRNIKKEDDYWQ